MKKVLPLLMILVLASCGQKVDSHEPDYPANPQYPCVSHSRTFQLDGADTVWMGEERFEYDHRGRFLTVTTYDAARNLLRRITFAYQGNTDTMRVYDGDGRLVRRYVHTYADSAFCRQPAYEGPYYRNVIKLEEYDPAGTLVSLANHTLDAYNRVEQTNGFDIDQGILYKSELFYAYGSDYTIVHNPKSENETMQNGHYTYADSLCRYPLTHSRPLKSGVYEQRFTYDSQGRRTSFTGSIQNVSIDNVEYRYFEKYEEEVDHESGEHIIRYYL